MASHRELIFIEQFLGVCLAKNTPEQALKAIKEELLFWGYPVAKSEADENAEPVRRA